MTEHRPYPNIRWSKGRWVAYWPNRQQSRYLGAFDTPGAASAAVLLRQAEYLENKASDYRRLAQERDPTKTTTPIRGGNERKPE